MSRKRIVLGHDDAVEVFIKGVGQVFTIETSPVTVYDNPLNDEDAGHDAVDVTVTDDVNGTYVDQNTFDLEAS